MTENAKSNPSYNKENDLFGDLWTPKSRVKTDSWTRVKGRRKVKKKNESVAKQLLNSISEDKSEDVLGGAKTWGDGCPICHGKGVIDCKFCPPSEGYCPVCQDKKFAYCTMCRADDFRKKQAEDQHNSAERPQG